MLSRVGIPSSMFMAASRYSPGAACSPSPAGPGVGCPECRSRTSLPSARDTAARCNRTRRGARQGGCGLLDRSLKGRTPASKSPALRRARPRLNPGTPPFAEPRDCPGESSSPSCTPPDVLCRRRRRVVAFLASPAARDITGQSLSADIDARLVWTEHRPAVETTPQRPSCARRRAPRPSQVLRTSRHPSTVLSLHPTPNKSMHTVPCQFAIRA